MNNLPDATRIPPRINKIVAMRKYAPIAKNGNGLPPPALVAYCLSRWAAAALLAV